MMQIQTLFSNVGSEARSRNEYEAAVLKLYSVVIMDCVRKGQTRGLQGRLQEDEADYTDERPLKLPT
jgi:hypothetical protein